MFNSIWPTMSATAGRTKHSRPKARKARSASADAGVLELGGPGAIPSPALTPSVLGVLLATLDAIAVLGASYVAFVLWLEDVWYVEWASYAIVTMLGTLLSLNCFGLLRLYHTDMLMQPGKALLRLLGACALVAGILIALSYFTKTSADYSRAWAGLWFLIAVAWLAGNRALMLVLMGRGLVRQRLRKRILLAGEKTHVERLLKRLEDSGEQWLQVVQVVSWDDPKTTALDELERCIRTNKIDAVVIAVPWVEEEWVLRLLESLYQLPVDVLLCPQGIGLSLIRPRMHYVADIPMLSLAVRPLSGRRYLIKEAEDRILAGVILVLILPVLAVIALLVKLDSPGPVLFRQKRYGFNNQPIDVWKFRTMYHDQCDPEARQLTQRNDPRVTPVGRFLRSTSLDELPQFFHVLHGEMSIVGPRPHAIAAKADGCLYQEVVRQYAARHRVKPGITGWAQVNGWRGGTETVEQIRRRVHHDIAYIDDWSLWLDLKIILLTLVTGFTGKNAY